jgi:hypothetical protein
MKMARIAPLANWSAFMSPSCSLRLSAILTVAVACCAALAFAQQPKTDPPAKKPPLASPGDKAQVSLFGIQAEGSKFVYVLDRSGSTEGKVLAAAKAAILASIETIDDVHQFQLVVYNERPKVFNPAGPNGQLAFGTENNRAEVKRFLATISADGGTDHSAALSTAVRMHPDVIFLLSDGDDPKLTAHDLERIDRIGAGIIINTIQFGEDHKLEHGFMEKLAKQSGGEYKFVDATKLGGEKK